MFAMRTPCQKSVDFHLTGVESDLVCPPPTRVTCFSQNLPPNRPDLTELFHPHGSLSRSLLEIANSTGERHLPKASAGAVAAKDHLELVRKRETVAITATSGTVLCNRLNLLATECHFLHCLRLSTRLCFVL